MSSRRQRRKEAKKIAKKSGGKLKVAASLKELEKIKNEIPFYPLDIMAGYVDGVTSETYNDVELHGGIGNQIKNMSDADLYSSCNATSFGNCAFLILNSKHDSIKKPVQVILQRMKDYIIFLGKSPELDEKGFYNPNNQR